MIVVCVPVYDNLKNKRTRYTIQCIEGLKKTINPETTKVVFIDNASCKETKDLLAKAESEVKHFHLITNEQNEGTAQAINIGIHYYADPEDYVVKMDNDCVVNDYGWADEMVKCFEQDYKLGVLGLKRKDLPNSPDSKDFPTELKTLNDGAVVEICEDIIGTCLMINPNLRKVVGYFKQIGVYGFDDNLMCVRSIVAGYYNAFLPHIDIDHVDVGNDWYTEHKRNLAKYDLPGFERLKALYLNPENIYYNPFEK